MALGIGESTETSSTSQVVQSSSPDLSIPTRRMDFEEAMANLPKHFARDGDLISSHIIAALSSVFPDGEDFFVRSVRHYRDQITDPVLKRQVAGFIGQESIHGREHRTFNNRLAKLGYPTKRGERIAKLALGTRERFAPAISNLAETAALEHFTATLAEMVLTEPEIRDIIGNDAVRDLFVWHALEEAEHKAVAFDVYRAVGGSERMRIITMKAIRMVFVTSMTLQVCASLATDRATYQKGRLRSSFRTVKNSPLARRSIWRTLCEYDRKGFHPNDLDNTALMVEWREELFGDDGTMVHYLRGQA
ncbi:MAG: metal-dependent hydrolase [Microthrixaceae bacterium]